MKEYKKMGKLIYKNTIGCLAVPLLFIGFPILLIYVGGRFFTETSVGQFLGNVFIHGWIVFFIGCELLILCGIGYVIYSNVKDSTDNRTISIIAAIIGTIVFLWILNTLPKSCNSFNPDHVHFESFH